MHISEFKVDGYAVTRRSAKKVAELARLNSNPWSSHAHVSKQLIGEMLADAEFNTAMKIANNKFLERLEQEALQTGAELHKMALVLYRYASRHCTRATPFGLFASTSCGSIEETASARPAPRSLSESAIHVSLDQGLLSKVRDGLISSVQGNRKLCTNPLAYVADEHLWVTERKLENGAYKYALVRHKLGAPELVTKLLADFRNGALLCEGIDAVIDQLPHISKDQATSYLENLVRRQILAPMPQIPLLSRRSDRDTLGELKALAVSRAEHSNWADILGRIEEALDTSATNVGAIPTLERQIQESLETVGLKAEAGKVFHVDLFANTSHAGITPEQTESVFSAVDAMLRLNPPGPPNLLIDFAKSFSDRYGERFVGMLEVINPEIGLGFGFSAENKAWYETLQAVDSSGPNAFEELSRWLRSKLSTEVVGQVDIATLATGKERNGSQFPMSLSFNATPLPNLSINGKQAILLNTISGPGPGVYTARFAAKHTPIDDALAASIRYEEELRPNVIFAEIIHAQSPRLTNVLIRPPHRKYSITLTEKAGDGVANIPLDDIYVGVVGGRVVLWSKALDREIMPTLTNAHNFMRAECLGAYQFLAMIRMQHESAVNFVWPQSISAERARLPRVVCGNVIVSLEQWRVTAGVLARLKKFLQSDDFDGARNVLQELNLPRKFTLRQGDHLLEVDSTSDLSLSAFVDLAADYPFVTVTESILPYLDSDSPRQEVVVPFRVDSDDRRRNEEKRSAIVRRAAELSGLDSYLGPTEPYRYVKLYGKQTTAESFMQQVVKPAIDGLISEGGIKRWHFLRYADPDFHIRIRVFGDSDACNRFVECLGSALYGSTLYHDLNMSGARYAPEVVRYGGPAQLHLAEMLFSADSSLSLHLAKASVYPQFKEVRLIYCVAASLAYLEAAMPKDGRAQIEFASRQLKNFEAELKPSSAIIRQADSRFRENRSLIESCVAGQPPKEYADLNSTFQMWKSCVTGLIESHGTPGKLPSFTQILPSILHMLCNRALVFPSRAQEYIVWHHAIKLIRSANARSKSVN